MATGESAETVAVASTNVSPAISRFIVLYVRSEMSRRSGELSKREPIRPATVGRVFRESATFASTSCNDSGDARISSACQRSPLPLSERRAGERTASYRVPAGLCVIGPESGSAVADTFDQWCEREALVVQVRHP